MLSLLPTELWDYSVGDVLQGLRAVVSISKLNKTIALPDLGNCVPSRSARAGIVLAIRALGLAPGAPIGVPLFCCPVVFKAIQAAGCVPRFIDVEPETCCLSPSDLARKLGQIDALVAVHMFGNVCDIQALLELMAGKPIIEDCAQALGSKLRGRAVGSFGSVAVFSFRSGKYLSVGEGGALFSSQPELHARIVDLTSSMPYPGQLEDCWHVAKTYLRSKLRSRPLYGALGYRLWQTYNKKVDYTTTSPLVLGQGYRSDLALAVDRLPLLNSAVEKRRQHAEYYAKSLRLEPGMLCRERREMFYNRYQFPLLFEAPLHRDKIAAYLHSRDVGSSKPYKDIAEVAAAHYGYAGDCPQAEQVASRVLVIPSQDNLNQPDLNRISKCVNEGWAKIKG